MQNDPGAYTALNFFTLGLVELLDRSITPEEPLSFAHFMDLLGLLTVLYGGVKGVNGIKTKVDPPSTPSATPAIRDHADDLSPTPLPMTSMNRLPNFKNAKIDPRKVIGYALNPDHSRGGNKAKVFQSALGYNLSNADDLIAQIFR